MKKLLSILFCSLVLQMEATDSPKSLNEKSHEILIDIKIKCPPSEEFDRFFKSIPALGTYSSTFEEWKASFVNNMTQLIKLVESEKIFDSSWSVKTSDTE